MGLTLIDQFERDDRRWVLAIDNRPAPVGLAKLSEREREVVRQAILGLSNKVTAYNIGLAHSTVRVLLARAAAKLGAGSRAELVARPLPGAAPSESRSRQVLALFNRLP